MENIMKLISVDLFGNPDIDVRENLPYQPIEDKNKKPFIARQSALIKVTYEDKSGKQFVINVANECNYKYDGASIPFRIGKGNMKLLIPALYHDIICEDKSKIKYLRNLSSLIFRELLIQCGVNKVTAQIMYLAVDNFQRFKRGWKN